MIKIVQKDLLDSNAEYICHQVNCLGAMNSGVAKQIREKYPQVYEKYKKKCDKYKDRPQELLGKCQFVKIDEDKYIVNIFGQLNFGYDKNIRYTDIDALRKAFKKLSYVANPGEMIAIPYKLGCCRGNAIWEEVSMIINDIFADSDVNVEICELDKG